MPDHLSCREEKLRLHTDGEREATLKIPMKSSLVQINTLKRYLLGRLGALGAVSGPVNIEADGDRLDDAALSSTSDIQVNMVQSLVLHTISFVISYIIQNPRHKLPSSASLALEGDSFPLFLLPNLKHNLDAHKQTRTGRDQEDKSCFQVSISHLQHVNGVSNRHT